jgi:hypothetical protein
MMKLQLFAAKQLKTNFIIAPLLKEFTSMTETVREEFELPAKVWRDKT